MTSAGDITSAAAPGHQQGAALAGHRAHAGQAERLRSALVRHAVDERGVRGDLVDRERARQREDHHRDDQTRVEGGQQQDATGACGHRPHPAQPGSRPDLAGEGRRDQDGTGLPGGDHSPAATGPPLSRATYGAAMPSGIEYSAISQPSIITVRIVLSPSSRRKPSPSCLSACRSDRAEPAGPASPSGSARPKRRTWPHPGPARAGPRGGRSRHPRPPPRPPSLSGSWSA